MVGKQEERERERERESSLSRRFRQRKTSVLLWFPVAVTTNNRGISSKAGRTSETAGAFPIHSRKIRIT